MVYYTTFSHFLSSLFSKYYKLQGNFNFMRAIYSFLYTLLMLKIPWSHLVTLKYIFDTNTSLPILETITPNNEYNQ